MTELVKLAALEGAYKAIDLSPADTGRLISNWILTTNGPSTRYRSSYAVGIKGSSRSTVSGTAKSAAGSASERIKDRAYITNNTPYLTYVENGSKTTSPRNIIPGVLNHMSTVVASYKLDLGD